MDEARKVLLSLCEMVGMRLRQAGFSAKLISVYLRNSDLQGNHTKENMKLPPTTPTIFSIFPPN